MSSNRIQLRVGADVGGTFTDVILMDDTGHLSAHKVPSTPPGFARAVLSAPSDLQSNLDVEGASLRDVAHGTTVATNAVLEH